MSDRTPTVVLITGPPASGKTTVARYVVPRLGLPHLARDVYKELLFDQLGVGDRQWSRRMGIASRELLGHVLHTLVVSGTSCLVEGSFDPTYDLETIRIALDSAPVRVVQVHCDARPDVLIDRFRARWATGNRHRGHVDSQSATEMEQRMADHAWPALPLPGAMIEVATDDFTRVDLGDVLARIQEAMRQPGGDRPRGLDHGRGGGVVSG